MIKRLAVLPYFVRLGPHPGVGGVHASDEEVEEDDGGDALEEGPHHQTHGVGKLQGYVVTILGTVASITLSDIG